MADSLKKLISVCVPAYNEQDCVDELAARLIAVFDTIASEYDFEAIICENGSTDDTYEKLLAIHRREGRFKIVRLARNFYAEGGTTAALAHARGDAAVIMNCDLQDPPEYIPEMLKQWEAGYGNVFAIVSDRAGESPFRRFFARGYYWIMDRVSDSPVPRNVSDFRLIDRALYETYLRMPERYRHMRAMWPWIGFKSIGIETQRPARAGGASKFRFFPTFYGAIRTILAASRTPIQVIPVMGLALSTMSFVLLAASIAKWILHGVPFDGFGTIVALMLLLFGFLFLFLGMLAEYIGLIFEEVRHRPFFIVAETHGLEGRQASGPDPVGSSGLLPWMATTERPETLRR